MKTKEILEEGERVELKAKLSRVVPARDLRDILHPAFLINPYSDPYLERYEIVYFTDRRMIWGVERTFLSRIKNFMAPLFRMEPIFIPYSAIREVIVGSRPTDYIGFWSLGRITIIGNFSWENSSFERVQFESYSLEKLEGVKSFLVKKMKVT